MQKKILQISALALIFCPSIGFASSGISDNVLSGQPYGYGMVLEGKCLKIEPTASGTNGRTPVPYMSKMSEQYCLLEAKKWEKKLIKQADLKVDTLLRNCGGASVSFDNWGDVETIDRYFTPEKVLCIRMAEINPPSTKDIYPQEIDHSSEVYWAPQVEKPKEKEHHVR